MRRTRSLFALLVILLLTTACSGDEAPQPPATTPSPEPSATAEPTQRPARPTPTSVPGAQKIPSSVWLLDAATGTKTVIFEDTTAFSFDADFGPAEGTITVGYRETFNSHTRLDLTARLDGTRVSTAPQDGCTMSGNNAQIDGRTYPDVQCGVFSPDRKRMAYHLDAGEFTHPSGYKVPVWDQWVIDLTTGQRTELQKGLLHCGGCDSRYGPGWSVSGLHFYFAEFGGEARVWVADVLAGTVRQINAGPGANELGKEPDWSPVTDLLLYRTDAGTIIDDVSTGSGRVIQNVTGQSHFDLSGAFIYEEVVEKNVRTDMRVIAVADGSLIATLPGSVNPVTFYDRGARPVTSFGSRWVAALERPVSGCAGVIIYLNGAQTGCIVSAEGAVLSPHGAAVIAMRPTGSTGPVELPTGPAPSVRVWEAVLFDVQTGRERVLASDIPSSEPPLIVWNATGTQLLLRFPAYRFGP